MLFQVVPWGSRRVKERSKIVLGVSDGFQKRPNVLQKVLSFFHVLSGGVLGMLQGT